MSDGHQLGGPDRPGPAVRGRHRDGLPGREVAAPERPGVPARMGLGRQELRHHHHLVPARWRPLHRVHLHRGAGGHVGDRRGVRLLRRAVHDRALPDHLLLPRPDVVGGPPSRLRHHRGHRAGPVRHPQPEPGRGRHRDPRHDALHRAAAGRHPGRARGGRSRREQPAGQGPPAADRLRRAGRVHLLLRSAGAGDDRLRQGHLDLHRDRGGHHLPAAEVRRLGRDLRCGPGQDGRAVGRQPGRAHRILHSRPAAALGVRVARPGLGAGAVHVPALRHRHPELQGPQHRATERRDPAGVLTAAGPAGAARLHRDQGRHDSDGSGRQDQSAAGHPPALRRSRSRAGSPGSPSVRSPSGPWCPPRSCRSPRPTCSPATSTRPI